MTQRLKDAGLLILLTALALAGYVHLARPIPSVQAQVYPSGRYFSCVVGASTATTIQAVGGDCVAPEGSQSLYIVDINAASSSAAGTAADSMPTLKSVSGNLCASGSTTIIWLGLNAANQQNVDNAMVPIKVGAGNALCWIDSTAGTRTWVIRGWIGPA